MAEVNITTKIEIAPIVAFVDNHEFVNHTGEWWHVNARKEISLDDELADIAKKLPDGKYKIQILVTQISDNGWDI